MKTNKRFIIIMLIAGFLLLIPAVAKLIDSQMPWNSFDFLVAAVLLFGTGILFEAAARRAAKASNTLAYKAASGIALATALFLIWSNLAVGIIGSEDNRANLMYVGVLAIGFIGAVSARFKPVGMALAVFAAAIVHGIITVIAIAARLGYPFSGPTELLMINTFFIVLWCASGLLFLAAARPPQGLLNESRQTP